MMDPSRPGNPNDGGLDQKSMLGDHNNPVSYGGYGGFTQAGSISQPANAKQPPMAIASCVNCHTTLTYPQNSLYIQCPKCQHTMNPQAPDTNYINCLGCTTLLSHPPSSLTIQCPKCLMIMELPVRGGTVGTQETNLGGKSDTRKRRKDPNAPRRASNAYMIFCKERRAQLKKDRPDLPFGKLGAKLGEMWREMSPEDRKPYEAKAAMDRERFKKEMETYNAELAERRKRTKMESHIDSSANSQPRAVHPGGLPQMGNGTMPYGHMPGMGGMMIPRDIMNPDMQMGTQGRMMPGMHQMGNMLPQQQHSAVGGHQQMQKFMPQNDFNRQQQQQMMRQPQMMPQMQTNMQPRQDGKLSSIPMYVTQSQMNSYSADPSQQQPNLNMEAMRNTQFGPLPDVSQPDMNAPVASSSVEERKDGPKEEVRPETKTEEASKVDDAGGAKTEEAKKAE